MFRFVRSHARTCGYLLLSPTQAQPQADSRTPYALVPVPWSSVRRTVRYLPRRVLRPTGEVRLHPRRLLRRLSKEPSDYARERDGDLDTFIIFLIDSIWATHKLWLRAN